MLPISCDDAEHHARKGLLMRYYPQLSMLYFLGANAGLGMVLYYFTQLSTDTYVFSCLQTVFCFGAYTYVFFFSKYYGTLAFEHSSARGFAVVYSSLSVLLALMCFRDARYFDAFNVFAYFFKCHTLECVTS